MKLASGTVVVVVVEEAGATSSRHHRRESGRVERLDSSPPMLTILPASFDRTSSRPTVE
jgi:hypothetical protein